MNGNAKPKSGVTRALTVLPGLVLLAGCAFGPRPDSAYAPPRPPEPKKVLQNNGAIYQEDLEIGLFEDIRPRRVGDILTIVLVEATSASKKVATKTSKKGSVELRNPIAYNPLVEFETDGEAAREFDGGGDTSQSNNLSGRITVTVAEVLPNGNLVVRGEKILALNEGDEYMRLSGIVRPQDIRPDNTVLSTQVADARITYSGRGPLAWSGRHGWLSRFFLVFWPF